MSNIEDVKYEIIPEKKSSREQRAVEPQLDSATQYQIQNLPTIPIFRGKLGKSLQEHAVERVRVVGAAQNTILKQQAEAQLEKLEEQHDFELARLQAFYRSEMDRINQYVLANSAQSSKTVIKALADSDVTVQKDIFKEISEYAKFTQTERNKLNSGDLDEDLKIVLEAQLERMQVNFTERMNDMLDSYSRIIKKLMNETER